MNVYINYYTIDPMKKVLVTDPNQVVEWRSENDSWYIKMGYAGFNSIANNCQGYKNPQEALRDVLFYQDKSA